jgi:hypothetical protein
MHADRADGESKQCRWHGGTASAIAVILCAFAGATGLIAPPAATAMTNEELATICSSVFSEIGDPSICANNFPSSEGTGGGSYATEPRPGVVVIIDSKPDPNRVSCGSGIDAARGVDCLKKRRDNQSLGFTLPGGAPKPREPRTILRGEQRQATEKGSVKRCVLAQMTLSEYYDALKSLRDLENGRSVWGPDGNFLDRNNVSRRHREWNRLQGWVTPEILNALVKKFPRFEIDTDRHYLNVVRAGWEMLRKDAEEDLQSPTCIPAKKAKS